MIRTIYYIVAVLLNAFAAVFFYRQIHITFLSLVHFLLMLLMLFQGFYFKKSAEEAEKVGTSTAYGSDLTESEEKKLFSYNANSLFAFIPLLVPFVLFFPSGFKLLSILVYLFGFVSGSLFYRVRSNKERRRRAKAQKEDLKKQRQREEQGRWK